MRHLPIACVLLAVVAGVAVVAGAADGSARSRAAEEAVYKAWLKRIRLIEIRHLRSGLGSQFAEGRKRVLAIDDEAAVGPMVAVLYGPKPRYRGLLIEALTAMATDGSKPAQAYLQEIAVGDGSAAHRRRAIEGLKRYSGEPPTDRLMGHLALDDVPVIRDRAATALAALGHKRAVWLLVERLVTEDIRLVGGEAWSGSMQLDVRGQMLGVPTFRRVAVQAAVPGGVATTFIELPEVEVVDFATTIAMTEHHKPVPRYERVKTRHPQVLAALKSLTGKDFGYNQAAWQRWLESREADGVVPAWQPVRIGK
ncbi:MAG: HEAT repeat domain-containing protein [Phycisphaerae bacterium]